MSGMSTTSSTTMRTMDDNSSKVLPGDKTGLPLEVWQMVFSYLSFRDLCYVARVSKTWHDLALSVDMTRWKELYLACREWRHPYWPLDNSAISGVEPSSWKLAFRDQHRSTRLWRQCSWRQLAARKTGCMTLLKRVRERQVIEVGPGSQHETLRSAFAVANEYDKILVHPGIYDEQLELSVRLPFELVGVGELGSVILVLCLEQLALSGRLSNLVLRAPWFTNFIFKVRSGYLQMDNCIMEEGMMCVSSPASCHVQFCTFRHSTIILQHVNASVIRNCEFSQSNNANIIVEGYPKEEKSWAYPHLCQETDAVFSHRHPGAYPHPLKVTDSTTSTLRSSFTRKSLTTSILTRTFDTLSRGRAGSQDVGDSEGGVKKNAVGGDSSDTVVGGSRAGTNSATNIAMSRSRAGSQDVGDSEGGVKNNAVGGDSTDSHTAAVVGGSKAGTNIALSRGRAGSQDVGDPKQEAGAMIMMNNADNSQTGTGSRHGENNAVANGLGNQVNSQGAGSQVNGHGSQAVCGTNGKQSSGVCCAMDGSGGVDWQRNAPGRTNASSVNADGPSCCSQYGASTNPHCCSCAKEPKPPHCHVCKSVHEPGPCRSSQTMAYPSGVSETITSDLEGEWLEINDERKPWQMVCEDDKENQVSAAPSQPMTHKQERSGEHKDASAAVKQSCEAGKSTVSSSTRSMGAVCENSHPQEHGANSKGETDARNNSHSHSSKHRANNGKKQSVGAASSCNYGSQSFGTDLPRKHSVEKKPQPPDSTPVDLASACVVSQVSGKERGGHTSDLLKAEKRGEEEEESAPQVLSLYQSPSERYFNGDDEFPQNLPPFNSGNPAARYHYHDPPLLHNPHPTPHHHPHHHHPSQHQHHHPPYPQPTEPPQACSSPQQAEDAHHVRRGSEHRLPSNGAAAAAADGEAADRRSERSFHSSRNGEGSSSDEDDDLSILNALEAVASSAGDSERGNDSSSSSDEEESGVEEEEFFHGHSEYDSSDAEESVIMLPHLRQKHLDASLSANAVNADVDSICSHASLPVTLRTWQDEGVLSQVRKVRGCLIHQCRMIHSKGGVMVSLQGHALVSACDISNVSYGIRCIQNARAIIVKNRIHHCRTSGIFMRLAASGLIAGNDIHSNNEAGLDIRKNADPIVQHNRIHHGKRSGVVVLGSGRGQIRSNSIYGNMEAGIYILYGGNPTVSENHIYDGKAAGIAVNEGGQGFIFDNTVNGNQWGGVDIRRGSCPMVCRNTITNGLGDGIVIGDQGQGIIENNVISYNAGCGLWLMSASRPYIHGNQICKNGDTGVMMVNRTDIQQDSPHMLLTPGGGEVGGGGGGGVGVVGEGVDVMSSSFSLIGGGVMDDEAYPRPSPKCSHTTLQHNSIYHNAGRGLAIELGEEVEVKFNAIYANQQDGVWVHQEAPVSLRDNSISSNYGHGVLTTLTPSVEIVGNGIYDNHDWGIQGSGSLHIAQNDIVGNQQGGVKMHANSICKIQANRIQAVSGPTVQLEDTDVSGSVVEDNTFFQGDVRAALDLGLLGAVVRDNKVVLPTPQPDKDPAAAPRPKPGKDSGGFNKTLFLRDPPPRPAIEPPPPPSTLPTHNVSIVTKVMVPSGDSSQQGSKLCCIL